MKKNKIVLTNEQIHLLSRIDDYSAKSIFTAMCKGDPNKLTAASIEKLMRKYVSLQEGCKEKCQQ